MCQQEECIFQTPITATTVSRSANERRAGLRTRWERFVQATQIHE
jgi:hypothetical protein